MTSSASKSALRSLLKELSQNGSLIKEMNRNLATKNIRLSSIPLVGLGQGLALRTLSTTLPGSFQPIQGFKTIRAQTYKGVRGSPTGTSKDAPGSQFLNEIMSKSNKNATEQRQLLEAYQRGMAEALSLLKTENKKDSQFTKNFRRLTSLFLLTGLVYTFYSLSSFINKNARGAITGITVDKYEITDRVDVTFDDVKGCDEVKKELQDVVEFLRNPGRFNKIGARLPKGVLLTGEPGVGKTLLARAVAGEANVPFLHATGSEFDELFVGTGAARMRKLFEEAKARAPCVLFIDEIDAVSSRRTSSPTHPYANQTINQLLSELDGFRPTTGIIVLGATNRREALDPAVVRPGRFDMEVVVHRPDYEGRKAIFELYLGKVNNVGIDVSSLALSTIGLSGADIESLVNSAAILAGLENAMEVTMDHIWKARDKMLMGPARNRLLDEECNKNTAYHEAGHALVAYYTDGAVPVHKITLIPHGPALGMTSFVPDKETHNQTIHTLKASLDVNMGGRVAEELIFGAENVSTGAHGDFRTATRIAESMVKMYGMSEAVGVRVYSEDGPSVSQSTLQLVDSEIKRLLTESYERARKILVSHAKEHKAVADALMKYETISREDMEDIIKGRKPKIAIEREKKSDKPPSVSGIKSVINLLGGGSKENKTEKQDIVKPTVEDIDRR